MDAYDVLGRHPATRDSDVLKSRIEFVQAYVEQLRGGERYEKQAQPNYGGAASAYFRAKSASQGDAGRAKVAQDRLDGLRGKWIAAIRATAQSIPAGEEQRFYDDVVVELAEMSRTLQVSAEQIEREFRAGR